MTRNETPAALIVQGVDVETRALKMLATLTGARSIAGLGNGAFRMVDARPHEHIARFCANEKLDWAWVPSERTLDTLKLAAFDMDSTLITIECIDELADFAGCKDKVAEITAAAMRGELDYPASLRQRVKLLAGIDAASLESVFVERLRFSPGAQTLLRRLRSNGVRTLLVSGGFTYFTDRVRDQLQIDYTRSNTLVVEDGRLTGELAGDIVDADAKAAELASHARDLGVGASRLLAVGDGANDLKMMALAGTSVAWRAKPAVQQAATHALDHAGLDGVLNLFAPPDDPPTGG
jgi:phosphoserine phosphatase